MIPAVKQPLKFQDLVYGLLRMLQILWVSAVMPLAIMHIRRSGVRLTGLTALEFFIFVFAGCLGALMIVALDQSVYPARLLPALLASGSTLAGIVLSFLASDGDIFFSAYTVFLASLVSITGFFLYLWIAWRKIRKLIAWKGLNDETEGKVFYLCMLVSVCTAWFTIKFMVPYVNYVAGLSGPLLKTIACASMVLQICVWARLLIGSSILAKPNPDPERASRKKSYEAWSKPIGICMVLCFAASPLVGWTENKTGSAQPASAPALAYKIQETSLANQSRNKVLSRLVMDGDHANVHERVLSRDGRHLAYPGSYSTTEGPKISVVVDGQWGEVYDAISKGSITFSPDGNRVAYGAMKGKKWFVVVDDKAGAEHDGISGEAPVFSPDGKHLAYLAEEGRKWMVVVDTKAGPEYDGVGEIVFSPEGKHLAYPAKEGKKWLVVVDTKVEARYDDIRKGSLVFSPDGKRMAYGAQKGDKWLVVVDGQAGPEYDAIRPPIFSPDGKRVVYVAQKGQNQLVVVVDGNAEAEYENIKEGYPIFSPDSQRVAYMAAKGGKELAVVDGKAGPQYDGIGYATLKFSPDGKHVAYVALNRAHWLVLVDGQAGPEYDGIKIGSPAFSPDGKHVANAVQKGTKCMVVVDGKAGPEYDRIRLGPQVFSPDSKRVAYAAEKEKKCMVVVDGNAGAEYDGIRLGTPVFSPDSRHVAYLAEKGEKRLVVVDGQAGPEYEGFPGCPAFSADGVLEYLAVKHGTLCRVKCTPVRPVGLLDSP